VAQYTLTGKMSMPATTDRGDWILTAYFAAVAGSGLLPLSLLIVEFSVVSDGLRWLGVSLLGSGACGWAGFLASARWLDLREWETGRAARVLGVPTVSRWLIHGPAFRRLLRRVGSQQLPAVSRRTLEDAWARSVLAERVHAAGFVAAMPLIVAAYAGGFVRLSAVLLAVNLVTQLYPVLVQRETRRRLLRVRGQILFLARLSSLGDGCDKPTRTVERTSSVEDTLARNKI
jgi:hypothetical protein